ncbi:MAG: ATP-binding protein [Thermoplasmatota archaeon]|nr:PAS domain-containing protein [Halobacteriales archaeon]
MAATPRPASMPAVLKGPAPAPSVPAPPTAEDLLSIIGILPDVLFRCVRDERGTIRWTMNEGRLAEEFHVTTKDCYGKSLQEMFPPDVAERQLPHFEAAFRGEAREWVNEMAGRVFKHYPQPVKDASGRVVAVVGFISEVTGLVEAERQAKRLNGELMARLVELREANMALAQANRDLDGFAAAASHDLKNPLNLISTNVYLLEQGLGKDPVSDGARLQKIEGAVRRMADLTSDLLRFSRASDQAFRPEAVDVSALAREVAAELAAQDPEQLVQVQVEDGLAATADRGLLRLVLENLMGNAWKYSSRSRRPAIMVRREPADPLGRPVIAIADNGIGFSQTDAANLFQAFQRLPGSEGFAGTGMGLATVRRIVERHGGRVWAEGRPGQGATFRFTLGNPVMAA